MSEFLTDKHKTASRSVGTRRLTSGTTSSDKPFYLSRVVNVGTEEVPIYQHQASIYNDNTPMQVVEAHYIDGIETEDILVSRGEVFTDCRLYDEGVTHYKSYMLLDYDRYLSGL